uniref:Reverse transcriptase Ty1/copia-type domain-containing protein n=1 Tax=Cannabis sativa TaxID=3483 RepID=A0A803QAA5_CANSA
MAAKRERAAQWLSTVERRRRCVAGGGEVVVVPTVIGHDLDEILFHRVPSPSTLVNGSPNPMFAQRRKKDQLLLSWLRSSPSEGVLTSIANFQSSYMVWKALEQRFNSQSRARLLQLKNQFSTIRKGNLSISDYADKNLADSLAVAGSTMNDQDIIMQFLNGLGPEYDSVVSGPVHYFLGVEIHRDNSGMFLSQSKYITDLLVKLHMEGAKAKPNPTSAVAKLALNIGEPLEDITLYRITLGALQYLSLTRLDAAVIINKLSQFLHAPTSTHWEACKRVLRYLKGTISLGLHIQASSFPSLTAYSGADWAGCIDD